jgi:hypothetical protein
MSDHQLLTVEELRVLFPKYLTEYKDKFLSLVLMLKDEGANLIHLEYTQNGLATSDFYITDKSHDIRHWVSKEEYSILDRYLKSLRDFYDLESGGLEISLDLEDTKCVDISGWIKDGNDYIDVDIPLV